MPEQAFCSWSGGKDSCLALWKSIQSGTRPQLLLTMMIESGTRSRSHGLSLDVLALQSEALGVPVRTCPSSWKDYEEVFGQALKAMREEGITSGVFGDIDVDDHRKWVERVCASRGIRPSLPLWNRDHRQLVEEFLDAGFVAKIVAVKDGVLGPEFLGKDLSRDILDRFVEEGVDPAGEAGEYHTVVTNGPLFAKPLMLAVKDSVLRDGYRFIDLAVV